MALQTFAPNPNPTTGSATKSIKPRLRMTTFGDGYSQRVVDGINTENEQWSLGWDNLTTSEANVIEQFFLTHGGVTAFYWTPPRESTPKKWVCQEWTRIPKQHNADDIRASFVRVFDL